jgi:hypothetical protein
MAEGLCSPEGDKSTSYRGEVFSSPESKSMACHKSEWVNVGEPHAPAREAVLADKLKKRGSREGFK